MAKIRYIKATFDSPKGRIREVSLANARALVSMKLAEYYSEEFIPAVEEKIEVTQKEKSKRGRPANK